jgi:hypothetical protein
MIAEVEKLVEREEQVTASLSAFVGFGRSTDLATKQEQVQSKGGRMVTLAARIEKLEAELNSKPVLAEGEQEFLDDLKSQLNTKKREAEQRINKLGLDLSQVGQTAEQKRRNKTLTSPIQFPRRQKGLKLRMIQPKRFMNLNKMLYSKTKGVLARGLPKRRTLDLSRI